MRLLQIVVIAGLGYLLIYSGVRVWQEATYGAGARVSSGAVDEPAREIAFVSNAVAGTVSLVDVSAARVIATMNVVPDGKAVGFFRDPYQSMAQESIESRAGLNYAQDTDLSRDGRVLFVSRGYLGDVAAFDLETFAVLWRTPIAGIRADHMDISPDGKRLYVTATIRGGDVADVLDTETGETVGQIATGRWPHDVHVTETGERVYIASLGDMTKNVAERGEDPDAYKVTVADPETFEIEREYTFDMGVRPFQVTRDETVLYAQLSNTHAVVAHDLRSGERIMRTDLPVAEGVSEDDWDFEAPHHGLALSPDEETLCVAGRASDYAGLVRAEDLALIATVPVGDGPSWSVFTGDGRNCLLANSRSDTLSIVSLAGREETARIPVGRGAKHITVGRVPESVLKRLSAPRSE